MKSKVLKIAYAAVVAALTLVFTMFVKIPVPATNGYIHIGDSMIFIGVYLIGIYAIPAAAIGSMLSDILLGYATYAPVTFVVKAVAAFICWIVIRKREKLPFIVLGSIAGAAVVMLGYFLAEAFILGYGAAGALIEVPMNAIQGGFAVGITAGAVAGLAAIKFKQRIRL